ncbi:hypothetical protein [Desulfosporosinus fructosivorans]
MKKWPPAETDATSCTWHKKRFQHVLGGQEFGRARIWTAKKQGSQKTLAGMPRYRNLPL